MPYYRHLKDTVACPETATEHFDTMQAAREGINVKTEVVTFIASDSERADWHRREHDRFDSDVYLPTPWYASHSKFAPENIRYHFAHLSLKSPGLVAYTKNDEHGVLDRQTAVKPGKYLAEFYPDMSLDGVAEHVAACSVTAQGFKLATTEKDIVAIFGRTDCGFSSCMQSKRSPEYDWDTAFQAGNRPHPCAAYGDSDLAIAYLGDIATRITARVVVWPEKKIINLRSDGTVYGDQALLHILKASGYKPDSIYGARLRRIVNEHGTIMPYVDNFDWANPSSDGKWIILDNYGHSRTKRLSCSNHDSGYGEAGISDEVDDDRDDDDQDSERYTCEHCHDSYDYGDMNNGTLNYHFCDDCIDSSFECGHCDHRTWDTPVNVDGHQWCDNCATDATNTCNNLIHSLHTSHGAGLTECGEEWIEVNEFSRSETRAREANHTSHLCRKCSDGLQACVECAVLFADDASQCPTCTQSVRCNRTADLLTSDVNPDGRIYWQDRSNMGPNAGMWVWDGSAHYQRSANGVLSHSEFTIAGMDSLSHYVRVLPPVESSRF
jgi:hypothetical protein